MGPMIQQMQMSCDDCNGVGEIINHKDKCRTCNGKKVTSEKKILEVHIDKGMKGGQTITFRGESDQSPGLQSGDVVIVIEEKPHDRFKRQENDLFYEQDIDLLTALAGGQFAIKHLDDRVLIVNIHPGEIIKTGKSFNCTKEVPSLSIFAPIGDLKVVRGQGMPSQRHHEPGDLFVHFTVKFPTELSSEAFEHLEKALPPREPLGKFDKAVTEEVEIEEVDARQRSRVDGDEAMDEDGPGPRVQCAQQ